MLFLALFVLLYAQRAVLSQESVDINKCYVEKNGVRRPKFSLNVEGCFDKDPGYCQALFSISADELNTNLLPNKSFKVSKLCYSSSLIEDAMNRCKRTCSLCCELPQYKCDDVEVEHCQQVGRIGLCKQEAFRKSAIQTCPFTCGLCDQPGAGGIACKDMLEDCPKYKQVLNCTEEFMQLKCKATCRSHECYPVKEKPVVCEDKRKNCEKYAYQCNGDGEFQTKIRDLCQKTCEICDSNSETET